jgi:alpha-mannosidase
MLNCRAESRLAVAEKIMTTARRLLGFPYDSASLKAAWRQVMFNQFHDILAGTCIQEACDDAMEAFHEALNIAARIGNAALQKITWSVDTMGGQPVARSKETDWIVWENGGRGTPIVVFNPLCFPVRAVITINNESHGVTDTNGVPVPVQKVRGPQLNRDDKYNTLFVADLPSMGYAVYWAYKKKAFDVPVVDSPSAHGTVLENTHLRIEFDPSTGWMSSIRLKASGREVLEGRGCIPLVIDDSASDTWAHGIFAFKDEAGRFADAEICVLEQGPIRATLRVTNRYRDSVLRQDFSLCADGRDVEVSVKLDLREKHRMIKLSFPVNLDDTRAAYEVPYGFMEKNADGMEEAGQRWVAVTGRLPDGTAHGVSLVNVGKYSFAVDGNDLRMTIARTPIYADHFGTRDEMCEYMDQGVQEFRYVIDPISGRDPAALSRRAMRLNQEPVSIMETYHAGPLPSRHAGIEISHSNILASVFKRSEDDDGYILRCYEAGGIAAGGVEILLFGRGERRWKADFTPQEIKSFFIPDAETGNVQEVNLLEMENDVMEHGAR